MDKQEKIELIRNHVSEGELLSALTEFKNVTSNTNDSETRDTLILLERRYRTIIKEKNQETTSNQEIRQGLNKISSAILALVKALEVEPNSISPDNLPFTFTVGLERWKEENKEDFWGRTRQIEDCLNRLENDPCLIIEGASGTGKSSIVKAGIIPELREKGGIVLAPEDFDRRPPLASICDVIDSSEFAQIEYRLNSNDKEKLSKNPSELLDRLLHLLDERPDETKLIIFLDQFENLLYAKHDDNDILNFSDFITQFINHKSQRTIFLATIKSSDKIQLEENNIFKDFDRCTAEYYYKLFDPSKDELREIIVKPFIRTNLDIEPQLVDVLLDDLVSKDGYESKSSLPLLCLVLYVIGRNWNKIKNKEPHLIGKTLKLELYGEGRENRLKGALINIVNALAKKLTNEKKDIERLFFHLVRVQVDNRRGGNRILIRNQLDLSDIKNDEILLELIDKLSSDERFIVKNKNHCELVHDILFDLWDHLKVWIDSNMEVLFELSELERNAKIWSRDKKRLIPTKQLLELEKIDFFSNYLQNKNRNSEVREYVIASRRKYINESLQENDIAKIRNLVLKRADSFLESNENHKDYEKFFYALFPDEIKEELIKKKNDKEKKLKEAFGQEGDNLSYFEKEDLDLRNDGGNTLFHLAALGGNINVLDRLKELGAESKPNKKGTLPLHMAVYGNQLKTVDWFLDKEIFLYEEILKESYGEDNMDAVLWAAYDGHFEMLKKLVARGAVLTNHNKQGWSAIHFACSNGNADAIEFMLNGDADSKVNPSNNVPEGEKSLSEIPDSEGIESSEDKTIDANYLSGFNSSPLYIAAQNNHISCVKILLSNGANIDLGNLNLGSTPLMIAIKTGSLDLVKYLVEAGADTELVDKNNWNNLHYAASSEADSAIEMMEYLIEDCHLGSYLLKLNSAEKTPIQIAIENNDTLANYLIKQLKPDDLSSELGTALLDSAILNKNKTIEEYLLKNNISLPLFIKVIEPEKTDEFKVEIFSKENIVNYYLEEIITEYDENWNIPPLIAGDWQIVSKEKSAKILSALTENFSDQFKIKINKIDALRSIVLPFYPECNLYEARVWEKTGKIGYITFIHHQGESLAIEEYILLNGTSAIIHSINRELPIQFKSEEDVKLYLEFFCKSVHGSEGPFAILNSISDIIWTGNLEKEVLNKIEAIIAPVKIVNTTEECWFINVTILYDADLFYAKFKVFKTGMVEMEDDFPLASPLPVTTEYFNYKLNIRQQRVITKQDGKSINIATDGKLEFFEEAIIVEDDIPSDNEYKFTPVWSTEQTVKGEITYTRMAGKELLKEIKSKLSDENVDWELPPIIDHDWQYLTKSKASKILFEVASHLSLSTKIKITHFDALRQCKLQCYENLYLYEARALDGNNLVAYLTFVGNEEDDFILINGKASQIFMINQKYPLILNNPAQVKTYLNFYLRSIEIDNSIFSILDDHKRLFWKDEGEYQNNNILGTLPSVECLKLENADPVVWQLSGLVLYKTNLSRIVFKVDESGTISIADEFLISQDIPLFHDFYLDEYRTTNRFLRNNI